MSHTSSTSPNQVLIPQTTDKTIIFQSKNYRFERDYDPVSTGSRVAADQVNQVLTFTEKTLSDHLFCYRCFLYIWLLLWLIQLLYVFLFCKFESQRQFYPEYIGLVGLVSSGFLLILWRQRKIQQVRVIVQQTIDLQNQKLASVGVRWSLPKRFPVWIELHNDFRLNNSFDQPNYIPPLQQSH